MIANKGKFVMGMVMMIAFTAILVAMFMPIFGDTNGLAYMDDLYNSISKGSAYYIPKVKEEASAFKGKTVDMQLTMADADEARRAGKLFNAAGALVNVSEASLKVSGDLGNIIAECLADADALYFNKSDQLEGKYGFEARLGLYTWWQACKAMDVALKSQKKYKEAKMVDLVRTKAVETSYNYYGIEGQKITDRMGVVAFSLIFYVLYTLWYGFGIMYLFEGVGMQLEH